ncbi:hypothetical protein LCGC14_2477720 [marine sediment metagenome]|uniref:Uncharacterized protein n=1 Tax=marine sediment metagenome TaxID=412755 RepID=A0A0F9E2C6_9ZZZZ
MKLGYMEILVKCPKCGKYYSRRTRLMKCPHKLRDKLSRQLAGEETNETPT